MAAKTVFSNGDFPTPIQSSSPSSENGGDTSASLNDPESNRSDENDNEPNSQERDTESIEERERHKNERTYKIIESQCKSGGEKYGDFCVKNATGHNIDIAAKLKERPYFDLEKNSPPQILILHTHTTESYMKKNLGFFYESSPTRSKDSNCSVVGVGECISKELLSGGYNVIHDRTFHDSPSYNGSYGRAANTIKRNLQENPIKVVLDIHRDSMGSKETGKIKPTFTQNGEKAAQIMILVGTSFPNSSENIVFALNLQEKLEHLFPGITRPMYLCDATYNMNITNGSLLIEVGTEVNTAKEAFRSGELLGKALVELFDTISSG
jgi:stage II sporulation protein P